MRKRFDERGTGDMSLFDTTVVFRFKMLQHKDASYTTSTEGTLKTFVEQLAQDLSSANIVL